MGGHCVVPDSAENRDLCLEIGDAVDVADTMDLTWSGAGIAANTVDPVGRGLRRTIKRCGKKRRC